MNARQRLFAVLNGEPTDHTPIWLLFPYHSTGYYADVRSLPVYQPVFEASKQYAIMLNRRNPHVSLFSPEVCEWDEQSSQNGYSISRHILEYKGKRLESEIRQEQDGTRVKRLLTSPEDLEFYASLPVNLDRSRIHAELDTQMPQYLREKDEFPPEYGAMMLDIGEPVGPLYHAAQLEEYSIWSLTHSDLVVDLFDRFMQQKRIFYQYCLERDLADVYFMVGSELASPPFVSRQTFLCWIVPYATELIEMVHAHGKKVIQHYHGKIKRILPDFLTMMPDALHTIEAPPVGDCTFTQAFDVVGDKIALIGNIQYDDFQRFTPKEMTAAVQDVLNECRGKRLILSPSAGPYEDNISSQMVENYLAFMKAGWDADLK
jgi:uroporphyrinogen-III decarboxylase